MIISNHYLAELAGWHRVHYYDFIRPGTPAGDIGDNMLGWVQEHIPPERWLSWNATIWFQDPREATMFTLRWA
jgi:hypothetical protein